MFAKYVLGLPASQRPKTAAYAELDDPFSAPIAENIRTKFEAAGIKTVYKQVYPSETQDLSPVMAALVATKPDVIVGGTQNEDAYAQVKSLVQLKYNPKIMFQSNGANSPLEFPDKVGRNNTEGIMSVRRLVPRLDGVRQRGVHRGVHQEVRRDRPAGRRQQCRGVRRADSCSRTVAAKTNKIDNATIISSLHSGSWPTLLGNLSWSANGAPKGEFNLVQWQKGNLIPVYPVDDRARPSPRSSSRTGAGDRGGCMRSSRASSSASSPPASMR